MIERLHGICRSRYAPVVLFGAYLLVGLWLCDDYGVSWDEQINREFGHQTLDYARWTLGIDSELGPDIEERMRAEVAEQGPFFELFLAVLERTLRVEDSRNVLLLRHYATFALFWCGALAFYHLLRLTLTDRALALLGSVLLITTPRLFAHAFYNSKDTVLLAMVVIATLTMLQFLKGRTWQHALLHAITCAITIDIRIVGLMLPALTLLFLFLQAMDERFAKLRRDLLISGLYVVMLVVCVVLFWPQLWGAPLSGVTEILSRLGDARQIDNAMALFGGTFIPVDALPWTYLPTWMGLTIPPLIGVLFLVGLGLALAAVIRSPLCPRNRPALLFLLLLFVPLVLVLVLRPVLYDGWRHLYFVYPAFLAISMLGAAKLCALARWRGITLWFLLLAVTWSTYAVVRDHPYQNVYFNMFAGTDTEQTYELDYWGLSFREGLETILKREPEGVVKVAVSDMPGILNRMILPGEQRDRIRLVRVENADYFLSNHRAPWHFERFQSRQFPYDNEVHTIKVGNARILGIYRPAQLQSGISENIFGAPE